MNDIIDISVQDEFQQNVHPFKFDAFSGLTPALSIAKRGPRGAGFALNLSSFGGKSDSSRQWLTPRTERKSPREERRLNRGESRSQSSRALQTQTRIRIRTRIGRSGTPPT